MDRLDSESWAREFVEHSEDGISVQVDGIRVYVNSAYLKIHGLSDTSQAIGQPFHSFALPEDKKGIRRRWKALKRGEDLPLQNRFQIRRPTGEIRTLEASTTKSAYEGQAAVVTILRDVTDRIAKEDALRASEERFRSIVENSPIGLSFTDGKLRIVEANEAFHKMLGYAKGELLGKTAADITHPEDRAIREDLRL